MEAAVLRLRPLKSVRHTHLRAEHFKQWLREAYPTENSKTALQTEHCMCLVEIFQHMWRTGDTPHEFGGIVMVLITEVTTDNRGIGLLETL